MYAIANTVGDFILNHSLWFHIAGPLIAGGGPLLHHVLVTRPVIDVLRKALVTR